MDKFISNSSFVCVLLAGKQETDTPKWDVNVQLAETYFSFLCGS